MNYVQSKKRLEECYLSIRESIPDSGDRYQSRVIWRAATLLGALHSRVLCSLIVCRFVCVSAETPAAANDLDLYVQPLPRGVTKQIIARRSWQHSGDNRLESYIPLSESLIIFVASRSRLCPRNNGIWRVTPRASAVWRVR